MNLIILTDFHSFTVSEDKLQNSSIWRFLIKSGFAILVKIWKWLNFLILFHLSRKQLYIMLTFEFDHFDWHSKLYIEWRQTSKLVNLKNSAKVQLCDFYQNLKMTKLLNSVLFIKKTLVNHVYVLTQRMNLTQVVNIHHMGWPM